MTGPITAQDVLQVQFNTAMRGYDVDAVDSFLDMVEQNLRTGASALSGPAPAFRVTRRGYDREQVDVFIARLVAQSPRPNPSIHPPPPGVQPTNDRYSSPGGQPESAVVEPRGFLRRLFGG